jgi:hypothetical protein
MGYSLETLGKLFFDRNARANSNTAGTEDVGAESAAIEQALHHCRGRQVGSREPVAEASTRFAKFDATQSNLVDHEFPTDQRVQANPTSDEISPRAREVDHAASFCAKGFDFFGLDKRDVLARFVMSSEVPITDDACADNNVDGLRLDLGLA